MKKDSDTWDRTHSYETWLIHIRHDSFMWDMTHSYETWLLHMIHDSYIWDMTPSCETWLIYMRHDSLISEIVHTAQEAYKKRGFDPYTIFSLICTINSEPNYFPDLYHEWVSRGRYSLGSSGRVRNPLDSKENSCGETWLIYMRNESYIWDMTHSESYIWDMVSPLGAP